MPKQVTSDCGQESCCTPHTRLSPRSFLIAVGFAFLIYLFSGSSIFSSVTVNSATLPPVFFLFGLLAGVSTCSASLSSLFISLKPRFSSFAVGRVVSFSVLGLFLGFLGNYFSLSFSAINIINVLVSIFILYQSLKLLGILKINISLVKGRSPAKRGEGLNSFTFGLSSFFIPCGFTFTAQSLALASASPLSSSLILFFFALGSLIPLYFLNHSLKFIFSRPLFSQTLAFLLLFFSSYSLINCFSPPFQGGTKGGFESTQSVLLMLAADNGYSPNYFKIKAGQPVRWEITDTGTGGCTNAVIAPSLFDGPIHLVPGTTSVKEFISPATPGTYRFSCWMGMISGTIEVIN